MLEFKELLNIKGVSGYETEVRNYIIQNINKFVDEIEVDNIGNIIAKINGVGDKHKNSIVIVAHMDEVGVQVKAIQNDGKIKFKALGSLKVKNLLMNKIIFQKGTVGVVTSNINIKDIDPRDVEALEIDCGFMNREQAEEEIKIGDVGTFYNEYFENKNTIISKAIDNRVGCWVLMNIIKNLKKPEDDFSFIFTCQEENGFKGIKVAINYIKPDIAVVIDTISVESIEGLELGNGVAIKISDALTICNEELINTFKNISIDFNINTQLEVTDNGGTELSVIDESHNGIKVIGLSVPIKYGHSANSFVDKSDISECIKLLNIFIENFRTYFLK